MKAGRKEGKEGGRREEGMEESRNGRNKLI